MVDLAAARIHRKKILNGLINEYLQAAQPNHISERYRPEHALLVVLCYVVVCRFKGSTVDSGEIVR